MIETELTVNVYVRLHDELNEMRAILRDMRHLVREHEQCCTCDVSEPYSWHTTLDGADKMTKPRV